MLDLDEILIQYLVLDRKKHGNELTSDEAVELKKVKNDLHQQYGAEAPGAERRESFRVPTTLTVAYDLDEEETLGTVKDLSRGGVFVTTERPLEVGVKAELRLKGDIPDDSVELQEVVVQGEVVSRRDKPQPELPGPGMGIKFTEVSDLAKKNLDDLYERLLEREVDKVRDSRS